MGIMFFGELNHEDVNPNPNVPGKSHILRSYRCWQ